MQQSDAMTDEERSLQADEVPIKEGVVIPQDDLELVNDDSPTENVDPITDDGDVLDKRPTDGPL